jgi:uncharacterized membrane protein
MGKRILLAGESWTSTAVHSKGFDQFASATFHSGAEGFIATLRHASVQGFDIAHMPSHVAQSEFPASLDALQAWDAVLLSDIGANTLLLHPEVWLYSRTFPNRLKLLREYVAAGGGFGMIGGYLSFQGLNGAARYRATAVEEVLPVHIHPYDDRIEVPEGFRPVVSATAVEHPLLGGLPDEWPVLLGLNEVVAKAGATVLAHAPEEEGAHPLLVIGHFGRGRTLAWTTDIGPHWLPQAALDWPGFARLWHNLLTWLAG